MSTIFADKFKNTSGGNNVKVNQLSGIDTAGSITVQGEGTATTNLQQGLCKAFVANWDMAAASLGDSFNVASVTDQSTGRAYPNWTNNFASASYTHHCSDDNYGMNNASIGSQTTSQARSLSYHSNFALQDAKTNISEVGDLA